MACAEIFEVIEMTPEMIREAGRAYVHGAPVYRVLYSVYGGGA